jgi:hypothetical protein
MTASTRTPDVLWLQAPPRQPLCDVPWLGTAVVLSDGNVNFCCYSSTIVGNVNQRSFEEIWNGSVMRRVRRELTAHRLPPECQSNSCPFFRGDELNYIYDRMEGRYSFRATGTQDPHATLRERLQGTALQVIRHGGSMEALVDVDLEIRYQGQPILTDVFVAIRSPDGSLRFLPDFDDYATPFFPYLELHEERSPLHLEVLRQGTFDAGESQVCAALFASGSNPNLVSNCYWSEIESILLNSRAGSSA